MKHPRTLIREAVAALLSANLQKVDPRITASRISIHRSTPLFAGKLPAILIYTRDERIEDQPNADPGLRYRKLELSVEIIASATLASLIGVKTLGQYIFTGISLLDTTYLLAGGLPIIALVLLAEGLFGGVERLATPRIG